MKKFILACTILFIANVGCKKMNIGDGGACGCSPVQVGLQLNLVIKNGAGDDLLDSKVAGAYTREQIELYRKDAQGKTIPIIFAIRPPFSYGDEKFKFNQLSTFDTSYVPNAPGSVIYLKLGTQTYELTQLVKPNSFSIERVLVDQKEAEKDNGTVAKYATIFYLTR